MRATGLLRGPLALALAAVLALLVLGAACEDDPAPTPTDAAEIVSGVDASAVPAAARAALPLITDLTARQCPDLPPVWVVAQVAVESGWDATATSAGGPGAAGLYQLDERAWLAAGGRAWTSHPPAPGSDVLDARAHLAVAIPWSCANLHAVTAHLRATGKTAAPLDAMLVCHIAGCARVTGSAGGIPAAGEADCSARCAGLVRRYLDAVHGYVERYAARQAPAPAAEPASEPAGAPRAAPAAAPSAPNAYTGGATGCHQPDPTRRGGCLTGATLNGLNAVEAAFGPVKGGPVIHSAGCWDAHAWNPRSDHSHGRACDLFPTRAGVFPKGAELAAGWRLADWLRANAKPLHIAYLIWQGRYWDPSTKDSGGWGTRYTGGGVYDVRDATGGHYDHVHVSFAE